MSAVGLKFLSWVRTGLAAGIGGREWSVGDADFPARAGVSVSVTLNAGRSGSVSAVLNGPGDVAGLDRQQIIRMDPNDGARGADPNFFPLIEFDRADLPWLFSPLAPRLEDDARGLPGWLCLIALRNPRQYPFKPAGMSQPLPSVSVPVSELPDLRQNWLWAHAQALTPNAAGSADISALLQDPAGGRLSRLLAPCRLQPDSEYIACLVPAFEAGRLAGLGKDAGGGGYAWDIGGSGTTVELPVYASWCFSTGAAGDFQYLAAELKAVSDPNAGICRLDLTAEALRLGIAALADAGMAINLEGALVSPSVACGSWPDARQKKGFTGALAKILAPSPDVMAPPVYGSAYAGYSGPLTDPAAPKWLSELNLDPRYRVAAALGTQVIRKNQEDLMASAWRQAAQARQINAELRKGQLALVASRRIYGRRVGASAESAPLSNGQMMAFCAPVCPLFDRAALGPGGLAAVNALNGDRLAKSVFSLAYRKLLRPNGRLAKRIPKAAPPVYKPLTASASPAAPAAPPVTPSFDAFVNNQLFGDMPQLRTYYMPAPAPAAALRDGLPGGYLSDLLVSFRDQILLGQAIDFDGGMRLGWQTVDSATAGEALAALSHPNDSQTKTIKNDAALKAVLTYLKDPNHPDWYAYNYELPEIIQTTVNLPFTVEMLSNTARAAAQTGVFADQGQPSVTVLARVEEDVLKRVSASCYLGFTMSPGAAAFDCAAFGPGWRQSENGITVAADFGLSGGGAVGARKYDPGLYNIRQYIFTVDVSIEGNNGSFLPREFRNTIDIEYFWNNPADNVDYHVRKPFKFAGNAAVTVGRKYAFEYCLVPGRFIGPDEAAADDKTVWRKVGGGDNIDFGENISDANVAVTRYGGQSSLVVTWRVGCQRYDWCNGEIYYNPYDVFMIVGTGIGLDGNAAKWSKIQRLEGIGGSGSSSGPASVSVLGNQVFVLSGGIMKVYTLDADGMIAETCVGTGWPLPAGYLGGAVAALDIGPSGEPDLLFASIARLSGHAAFACYRIAYDVDKFGRPAAWGEAFLLPLSGLPTDAEARPAIRLFLGQASGISAARLAAFKSEFASATKDVIKRLEAAETPAPAAAARTLSLAGALNAPDMPNKADILDLPGVSPILYRAQPFTVELAATAAGAVRAAIDPEVTVRNRLMKSLSRSLPAAAAGAVRARLSPLLIAPRFALPAAGLLTGLREDSFFIGASRVEDNTVIALAPNNRFIEAFMAGLNHEMGRELLWRDFPADFRTTYFDTFWDRSCGGADAPDIKPMAGWDGAAALGAHVAGVPVGLLLCIRGDLIRRMPGLILYAQPAAKDASGARALNTAGPKKFPLFSGHMSGGVMYFAFDITAADALGGPGEGWFFVFQENPSAPRFGLNEPADQGGSPAADKIQAWNQLDWGMAALKNGYIDVSGSAGLAGRQLPATPGGSGRSWGRSAADMANITLQRPVKVAIHASGLI